MYMYKGHNQAGTTKYFSTILSPYQTAAVYKALLFYLHIQPRPRTLIHSLKIDPVTANRQIHNVTGSSVSLVHAILRSLTLVGDLPGDLEVEPKGFSHIISVEL